jgi:hypothetical protein
MRAFKSGTFKVCAHYRSDVLSRNTDKPQEGASGVIELKAMTDSPEPTDDSCDDPEIVKLMIEYFYHFDYLCDIARAPSPPKPTPFFVEHAKVFAMAIKYQAAGLRQLAASNFRRAACVFWNHTGFAHAIHIVYTSTPDDAQELRKIVADTVHEHYSDLQSKPEIDVAMRSLSGLAYSILKHRGSAWRCKKGHKGENLRQSCDCSGSQCAQRFDVCSECVFERPSVVCPFCKKTVSLSQ